MVAFTIGMPSTTHAVFAQQGGMCPPSQNGKRRFHNREGVLLQAKHSNPPMGGVIRVRGPMRVASQECLAGKDKMVLGTTPVLVTKESGGPQRLTPPWRDMLN